MRVRKIFQLFISALLVAIVTSKGSGGSGGSGGGSGGGGSHGSSANGAKSSKNARYMLGTVFVVFILGGNNEWVEDTTSDLCPIPYCTISVSEENLEMERCGTQEECDAVMIDDLELDLEDDGWGTGAIIAMVAGVIFLCLCCIEIQYGCIGICQRGRKQNDD